MAPIALRAGRSPQFHAAQFPWRAACLHCYQSPFSGLPSLARAFRCSAQGAAVASEGSPSLVVQNLAIDFISYLVTNDYSEAECLSGPD